MIIVNTDLVKTQFLNPSHACRTLYFVKKWLVNVVLLSRVHVCAIQAFMRQWLLAKSGKGL